MLSEANSRGPGLVAIVTPDTAVGVRVRSLSSVVPLVVEPSTELRSVAMAFAACANVIAVPLESDSPVEAPDVSNCKADACQMCGYVD